MKGPSKTMSKSPSFFTVITLTLVKMLILANIIILSWEFYDKSDVVFSENAITTYSDYLVFFEAWMFMLSMTIIIGVISICSYLGRLLKCSYSIKGMMEHIVQND